MSLCACGCGNFTPITSQSNKRLRWVKGYPIKYINGHNRRKSPIHFELNVHTGCWDWKCGKDSNGYGTMKWMGKCDRAHRVYYRVFYGQIPIESHIDHICRNTSCVNPKHLRAVSRSENLRNVTVYKNNKSGFKGVYKTKDGKFRVTVSLNGKTINIGSYASSVEAAHAYDDAIRSMFSSSLIRSNFPISGEFSAR